MKKSGSFESLLNAIKASANIGGDFMWEFRVSAGTDTGRLITQGDTILFVEFGDLHGLDALQELMKYDIITYEVKIYEGEVPSSRRIPVSSLESINVKVVCGDLKSQVIFDNFYDFLLKMEREGRTLLSVFASREGEIVLAGLVDGHLIGLRTLRENFSITDLLDDLRTHRAHFHLLEGEFVPYMGGYFVLSKVAIDTPAGAWNLERITQHEGVLESHGIGGRILTVSDGKELLLVLKPAIPPILSPKLLKDFQKRSRLVDAYPVIDLEPVFKYKFEDISIIRKVFNELIGESRKLVGEMIFKMASDRVLNFAHPTNPYPDEYAEFTKNVYKQYEDEIASFTGRRWDEIKRKVLEGVPEHIAVLFGR
ncbi:MAG: hypothetical protein GXO39_03980 [Thermotogae bacterium]|nr:hypothetical protein [Thermotogota bacterium]